MNHKKRGNKMRKSEQLDELIHRLSQTLPDIASEFELSKYRIFSSVSSLREMRRNGGGPEYSEDAKGRKYYSRENILNFIKKVYRESGIIFYNFPKQDS